MAIIQTSIHDMRNTITPNALDIYYNTDIGQEGEWYYDPTDTTSPDNTGTILVGQSTYRFKSIYIGYANLKWLRPKRDSDTPNDDTIAIQSVINFISWSSIPFILWLIYLR